MGTRYLANFDLAKLPQVFCDVLIVGTGIAGLYTALKAREAGRVIVLTKRKLEESNTEYAQGGIAAAIGDQDSPRLHLLDTLEAIDAFRRPERLELFVLACEADFRGRPGSEDQPYPQAGLFRSAFAAARTVDTAAIVASGGQGPDIGARIREARIAAVRQVLS